MSEEKEQEENLFLVEIPKITWDDLTGQDEAKAQMIEAIELPFKHKELFAAYGKKPTKGILLSGPPGCGKTMQGKAAANSLAKLHGDSAAKASFFYVKSPQLLSKWVGSAEKNVRILFDKARQHKRTHGYPALIFIDEADSILPNRDSGSAHRTAETVVAAFLTEMDGMQDSAAVIVLATNRPDPIDPAIVREGRIDRKVAVSRPLLKDGAKIITLNLERSKISKGSTHKELAKHTAKAIYSPRRVYYSVDTAAGKMSLTLAHLVNGAMLATVEDMAISLAIHRDIKNGGVSGVCAPITTAAWNLLGNDDWSNPQMCHGVGIANKPGEEGGKIAHAWIEMDHPAHGRIAIDPIWLVAQNADVYRRNLQVEYAVTYSREEFVRLWTKYDFPGPWDERVKEQTTEGKALTEAVTSA